MKINRKIAGSIRHIVALPLATLLTWWFYNSKLFDFHNIGVFWRMFLLVIGTLLISTAIEIFQGMLGANTTPLERKDMQNDIIVSTICALIGSIIGECMLFVFITQYL